MYTKDTIYKEFNEETRKLSRGITWEDYPFEGRVLGNWSCSIIHNINNKGDVLLTVVRDNRRRKGLD